METYSAPMGVNINGMIGSIVYALLGFLLMVLFMILIDKIFQLNYHRELVEEHNVALAILIAGMTVGLAIIIAASIQ